MLDLRGIFDILSLVRSRSKAPILKALLSDIAVLIILTVVTGIMIGAFILAILYAFYVMSLRAGFSPEVSMIVTAIIALLATAWVTWSVSVYMRRLHRISNKIFQPEEPIISRVSSVGEAFIRGLLSKQ